MGPGLISEIYNNKVKRAQKVSSTSVKPDQNVDTNKNILFDKKTKMNMTTLEASVYNDWKRQQKQQKKNVKTKKQEERDQELNEKNYVVFLGQIY